MLNVFLIIIYLILTVSGLVLFKLGATNSLALSVLHGSITMKFNYLVLIGMFCYICSFALYLYLVAKFNLSYIFPITNGIVYVLVFLASLFIFQEQFSIANIVGLVFVLTGVVLLNIKK